MIGFSVANLSMSFLRCFSVVFLNNVAESFLGTDSTLAAFSSSESSSSLRRLVGSSVPICLRDLKSQSPAICVYSLRHNLPPLFFSSIVLFRSIYIVLQVVWRGLSRSRGCFASWLLGLSFAHIRFQRATTTKGECIFFYFVTKGEEISIS